ncbi:hypothetical protein A6E15_00480 [Natrinema saccharevitans]|uniref:Uncharacterized protein n=1 Tax=Natrinema saccharevitans TaxID=301967 RepID=A0A1S8AS91_9EURY|nr:hypothetical protein A6E15_00480 [Natrinema saccharevitans]
MVVGFERNSGYRGRKARWLQFATGRLRRYRDFAPISTPSSFSSDRSNSARRSRRRGVDDGDERRAGRGHSHLPY